jgi:uncharacterized protein (DUF2141 family)
MNKGLAEKFPACLKKFNPIGAGLFGTGGKMKRKICRYILALTFFALLMVSPLTGFGESTGNLVVNISGFPSSEGFAMVALNNSEESYKGGEDAAIAKTKTMVVDKKVQVVFTNLPYGWYGISLYHDENSNGEMDKNAMGIPKEAYGFSNNAKGFFGKPNYKKVMFQLNSAEMQIAIDLN